MEFAGTSEDTIVERNQGRCKMFSHPPRSFHSICKSFSPGRAKILLSKEIKADARCSRIHLAHSIPFVNHSPISISPHGDEPAVCSMHRLCRHLHRFANLGPHSPFPAAFYCATIDRAIEIAPDDSASWRVLAKWNVGMAKLGWMQVRRALALKIQTPIRALSPAR
jgi:hypothetical protein